MTIKKLIKGGIIIVFGTLVGSVANYLYNTLTGRLLGPSEYGSFTSLLSLMAIITVPIWAIQTVAAKFTSKFIAEDKWPKVKGLILILHQRLWAIGLVITLLVMILAGPINRFLNLTDRTPLLILALTFFVSFLIPINRGAIQGMQSFFQLSLNTSLEAMFRLSLGLLLIWLGLRLSGAIAGVVAATYLAYIFSFLPLRRIYHYSSERVDKKTILEYSAPTLTVILCLTVLVNVDVMMAKHFLPATEAGYYGALSTVAKIIFYFSGPIVSVMFPMISDLYAKGERHFHLLLTTLLGVFGASLLILVFFTLAPKLTINLLYGQQFVAIWYHLPSMGIVMLCYGLVNVMANYFLSIGQMKFVPYLASFTVLEIIALLLFHSSIANFILVLMISQVLLLVVLFGIYIATKWSIILNWKEGR